MSFLESIGFYTLCDDRARTSSAESPLHRCELLLTKRCNFRCPYCRGQGPQRDLRFEDAKKIVSLWASEGLKNVRFSGGEPTIWNGILALVAHTKSQGVKRIAISTNGSAERILYEGLIESGVNDISISLDACCASTGDMMTGVKGAWTKTIENIEFLSKRTYVTVGIVLTNDNAEELKKIVEFAHDLGVSDIRIISASQWDDGQALKVDVDTKITDKHKILKYRLDNLAAGRNVRGITEKDSHQCPLVLDDMAVMGEHHYPCIIYLREFGEPIGNVGPDMRGKRLEWFETKDTHQDPICKKNCLDVCIDYNNRWEEFHR